MSVCQFKSRSRRPRVLFEVAFLLIFLKSSSSSRRIFACWFCAIKPSYWTKIELRPWYYSTILHAFYDTLFELCSILEKSILNCSFFSLRSMQNVFINLAGRFSPKMIKQNEKQTPRGLQK